MSQSKERVSKRLCSCQFRTPEHIEQNKHISFIAETAGTSNTRIPSKADRATIPSYISKLKAEELFIRAEISCLRKRKKEIDSQIERLRVAAAPHKHLPPEILSHIFLFFTLFEDAMRKYFPVPFHSRTEDPWIIRQVCSSWRKIALNTPSLWNHIAVTKYDYWRLSFPSSRKDGDKSSQTLGQLIPKTGPISIAIYTNPLSTGPLSFGVPVESIFMYQILSPIGPRLKDLILYSTMDIIMSIFRLGSSYWENLDSLYLSCLGYEVPVQGNRFREIVDEIQGKQIWDYCKRMRRLSLHGMSAVFSVIVAQRVPWSQLTYLKMDNHGGRWLQWDILLPVLVKCSNLITLFVGMCKGVPEAEELPRPFPHPIERQLILPGLKNLILDTPDVSGLEWLILPALTQLRVHISDFCLVRIITSLIRRSACQLKVFVKRPNRCGHVNGLLMPFDENAWHDLLSALRWLQDFECTTPLIAEEFRQIGNGVLLPNLEVLESVSTIGPVQVADLLRPRCQPGTELDAPKRIRDVTIAVDHRVNPDSSDLGHIEGSGTWTTRICRIDLDEFMRNTYDT